MRAAHESGGDVDRYGRQLWDVWLPDGRFLESVKRYGNTYGLGCTQTTTDVPFDALILRMMRTAGALR